MSTATVTRARGHGRGKPVQGFSAAAPPTFPALLPLAEIDPNMAAVVVPVAPAAPTAPAPPAAPAVITVPIVSPPVNIPLHAGSVALSRHFAKVDKGGSRDALPPGSAYDVALAITGTVNGESFSDAIVGSLTVGHNGQSTSTARPSLDFLLPYFAAKMNAATRAVVLNEALSAWSWIAGGGELAEKDKVDPAIIAQVEAACAKVFVESKVPKRGDVKFIPRVAPAPAK